MVEERENKIQKLLEQAEALRLSSLELVSNFNQEIHLLDSRISQLDSAIATLPKDDVNMVNVEQAGGNNLVTPEMISNIASQVARILQQQGTTAEALGKVSTQDIQAMITPHVQSLAGSMVPDPAAPASAVPPAAPAHDVPPAPTDVPQGPPPPAPPVGQSVGQSVASGSASTNASATSCIASSSVLYRPIDTGSQAIHSRGRSRSPFGGAEEDKELEAKDL